MECHIEIFHDGEWLDAVEIGFSDVVRNGFRSSDCVLEYDLGYVFETGSPPISLSWAVDADRHALPDWPAFLYDLVPQGNGRRFLLDRMRLPDAQSSDLPLLCAGAFNPIGRLRIREAVAYFEAHRERHGLAERGFGLDELLARAPEFHETMMVHGMLAAGGTGVQGVAPKYLLTRGHDGNWYPDATLPDAFAQAHFIVKRARGGKPADAKVLRNEAPYMRVAQDMGLRTAALPVLQGDMLFVPRFDRTVREGEVLRHHQESLASIAGLAGFGVQADQFDLVAALRAVVDDPLAETIEFIKRDVLNLAMRNTDNHARNTAVQVVDGATRLTPLFDFAPMYLDPEGITRAARWYHPATGKELRTWDAVLAHLALPTAERGRVIDAMRELGERLGALPGHMLAAGVDADIVDFLVPSVEAQRAQLLALEFT